MALSYEQQIGAVVKPTGPAKQTYMFDISTMYGSTGSTFILHGVFRAGRVGFRKLDPATAEYRVRVVPANGVKLVFPNGGTGWSQPGSAQNRFSIVVNGTGNLRAALAHASQILSDASVNLA